MTAQSDTVQTTREERFLWDEENRLKAISQNGYVSNYWYDADGERVIKEHGSNQAIFVNSALNGCVTQTGRYTVYPNAYYSYGDDGRYTKHIYIGSERVLSQVGGVYGEPRLLDVAGHDVRIKVDYPQIRASQDSAMEAAYTYFELPYNGTDHDDFGRYPFDLPGYWTGSLQSPRDGEEDENDGDHTRTQEYLYYYHTDHLGSSTLVTDGNGQLVQQIEYLPYGEVFLERQNGDYATPYKFNGKELDEETGLYYYGARYMNPRLSIWYGCDPLQERHPSSSTYNYCHSNPIVRFDPNGLYDFESTIGYFRHYPVIAVFPSDLTNNPLIEIDYSAAKSSGVPIMRVDNVEDFVAAMAQLENMFSSTDVYTLNSHGYQGTYDNPTHFYIGSDMITPENDFTNLKEGFQGRTIFIGACNVGCLSGRGFDLVENMSRQTNSRVIAPNHPLLAGYHYDGSDYLNRQDSNILTLPTTNEFIISTRGSDFDFIHNLRIDKNTGISWDGSFWNTITYFMKNQTSPNNENQ